MNREIIDQFQIFAEQILQLAIWAFYYVEEINDPDLRSFCIQTLSLDVGSHLCEFETQLREFIFNATGEEVEPIEVTAYDYDITAMEEYFRENWWYE